MAHKTISIAKTRCFPYPFGKTKKDIIVGNKFAINEINSAINAKILQNLLPPRVYNSKEVWKLQIKKQLHVSFLNPLVSTWD